ncbi:MAG: hypothetical protein D6753_09115 [Planctomycetota bacterium]|nr:MAG: hypothetical protein D6753_09115 [Planctomycetota bacterium]
MPGVGLFQGRLMLEFCPMLLLGQLFRRELVQLLVLLVELHFLVPHIQRGSLPLVELFGDPHRMLIRRKYVQQVRCGVLARTPRKVIFHPQPDFDRLRFDFHLRRTKRCSNLQRRFLRPTRRDDPLTRMRRLQRFVDTVPLQTDPLHAEVVRRQGSKIELLRIQNNRLLGQALRHHGRRFIHQRLDGQRKWLAPFQPQVIQPAESMGDRLVALNFQGQSRKPIQVRVADEPVIDPDRLHVAADFAADNEAAPLHGRYGAAPHIHIRRGRMLQILRQPRLHLDAHQLRSQRGYDLDGVLRVPDAQGGRQRCGERRQSEMVAVLIEGRFDGRIVRHGQPGHGRLPLGRSVQPHLQRRGFSVRHNPLWRQGFQPCERVARHVAAGGQHPVQRIARGGGIQREQPPQHRTPDRHQAAPQPQAGGRNSRIQVMLRHARGHLLHGRSAQGW